MVRHFKTRREAQDYKDSLSDFKKEGLMVLRKKKGMRKRKEKPFVVCNYIQWLNLY